MKKTLHLTLTAGLLAGLLPSLHAYAADGMHVFNEECAECHSIKEGKNKKGPSLWNIVGRKSAGVADFNYSDSMKASGITWTADKIAAYIEHPKQVVPAGKMKYDGLPDAKDRQAVIDYLSTLH
jgi:cytochrome c